VAEYLAKHPDAKRSDALLAARAADPDGYREWLASQQR
jgi:hypothetical protein